MVREDKDDIIYKNENAKFRAVVNDIKESTAKGQPVLVGTVSVEKSEKLSSILKKEEQTIDNTLNYDERIWPMDINETLRDAQFKDARPVATVEKILSILASHSIQTEETWFESKVPYCHALAIRIPGTGFCVNGKGLTPQFARASGYGELMERLQLGFTGAPGMQKDGSYSFDETKYPPIDCAELLAQSPDRYQKLAQRVKDFQNVELSPQQLLAQFANADGKVPCVPCYNLMSQKADWFPNDIRLRFFSRISF